MEAANLPEQMHSRPGTAVATRNTAAPGGLDVSDIIIPRMKIGQKTSRDVLDYGGVYVLETRDDPEPMQVLAPPKPNELSEALRFYIHGEPSKGWSWQPANEGGDWRGKDYPDLRLVKDQDPRNVRRTYDYLITLPAYAELPVMFIMHGQWGGQAAKQLNKELLMARVKGIEAHTIAFKLQTKKTSSPKAGQERPFIQALVGLDKVAAKDKAADQELVSDHHLLVGGLAQLRTVDDEDTEHGSSVTSAPALD